VKPPPKNITTKISSSLAGSVVNLGNVTLDPELQTLQNLYSASENEPELERYFYHMDHIGSSSWITDAGGDANQHLQPACRRGRYLPFGESFISQRVSSYDVRYKFTGKERDSETGFDYFGARYYDSDLSVWLSVDPMASTPIAIGASMSAYMNVAGNPVMLVDPNGMEHKPPKRKRRKRFKMKTRRGIPRVGSNRLKQRRSHTHHSPAYWIAKWQGKIETVPMGRYGTSRWITVGTGGAGKSTFSYQPPNMGSYSLRSMRVVGQGSGIFGTLITTGPNVANGAFGFPMDGLGALYGLSNGVPVGFIPLLNQFLYLNTFRGGILNMAGIYGILPNSIRLNPFFRRTTSWAVFRGGASNNQGYRLQIKVKQWRPYQNNRPFWHKWWYGL